MTVAEYIAEGIPPYEEARQMWIIFEPQDRANMLAKQSAITSNHKIAPVILTNGKFALCADLLTEINGGVFTELFQALNQQRVAVGEVVTEAEFLLLKPEEHQEP